MIEKCQPWSEVTDEQLAHVCGVCLDIDETLSTHGKLTGPAFQALWDLYQAGFGVVPVTGRPAGWCDHIARFWPVHAVVGENGAFIFYMEDGVRKRMDTPKGESMQEIRKKMAILDREIRKAFPQARYASDQAYRECDLAIDFCEDVPPWPQDEVERLLAFCQKAGAHAKLSSIHVNTWFGDFDKLKGLGAWFAAGSPGLDLESAPKEHWLFIGDSPNDEPIFSKFDDSVGVANIRPFLNRLKHPPRWITQAESGHGFVEMARRLIQTRKK